MVLFIGRAGRQHGPGRTRHAIGQRHRRHVPVTPFQQPLQPLAAGILPGVHAPHHGPRPMDQQTADIAVPALGDPKQAILVSYRATRASMCTSSSYRSASTSRNSAGKVICVVPPSPRICATAERTRWRPCGISMPYSASRPRISFTGSGTVGHGTGAHPVHRLLRLALGTLDGNKAHAGTLHCLTDRLGIGPVILVGLHIRLDELRRHQPCLMPQGLYGPAPWMRTATSLHADDTGGQGGQEGLCLGRGHLLIHAGAALSIHPVYMDGVLRQIDADECRGGSRRGMLCSG